MFRSVKCLRLLKSDAMFGEKGRGGIHSRAGHLHLDMFLEVSACEISTCLFIVSVFMVSTVYAVQCKSLESKSTNRQRVPLDKLLP